jgi:hypothetical protein
MAGEDSITSRERVLIKVGMRRGHMAVVLLRITRKRAGRILRSALSSKRVEGIHPLPCAGADRP